MEGEYQGSACARAGGEEDIGRRRGRRQKCKEEERNNNLKGMDLECVREESVGRQADKEECLNPASKLSRPFLSLSLQLC